MGQPAGQVAQSCAARPPELALSVPVASTAPLTIAVAVSLARRQGPVESEVNLKVARAAESKVRNLLSNGRRFAAQCARARARVRVRVCVRVCECAFVCVRGVVRGVLTLPTFFGPSALLSPRLVCAGGTGRKLGAQARADQIQISLQLQ